MPLQISIYNRQKLTSANGKEYIGRALAFAPGQRGAISDTCEQPPFYIRDQRGDKQWIRLEARTLADAKVDAEKQQHILQALARGVEIAQANDDDKQRLTHQVAVFLAETEANKSPATWAAYNRSLELFLESCKRLNVSDVKREDLLHFKTYLKKQEFAGRTVYNNFLNVCIFLAWAKHPAEGLGIKKGDWPPKVERDPEAYTEEEIDKLLKVASGTFRGIAKKNGEKRDDRLLLKAFLYSGLRDGELQHLSYNDIDVKHSLWIVRPKEGHELKTREHKLKTREHKLKTREHKLKTREHKLKTRESQRRVPVDEDLTKKIMERKEAEGKTGEDLIFPNTTEADPDSHLLRITKRVAKLAGIDERRVDNHKFRATTITTWLRNGNAVPDVMEWVGHVSPATILRYYAKVKLEEKGHRQKATQAFERYSAVGD
jgi:integrase